MKTKTIRNLFIVFVLLTALWMAPGLNTLAASAHPSGDAVFDETTIISDDFNPCRMKPGVWTKNEQDGSILENGSQVSFVVPSTADGHTIYGTGPGDFQNNTVNISQVIPDADFDIEVKFDSVPLGVYATQGVFIQQDATNVLRIEFFSNTATPGGNVYLYVGKFVDGAEVQLANTLAFNNPSGSLYLRIERTGDQFTVFYSEDGENEYFIAPFTYVMTAAAAGIYGGNEPPDGETNAPAYTAIVDYFFNTASPISPINGATLAVNTDTSGNGSVNVTPADGPYSCEDSIEIEAVADPGWTFSDWSGYWGGTFDSSTNPFSDNIYESIDVTATFTQDEYTFTTEVSPASSGSVTKNPDQSTYHYDDVVGLTAVAEPGYTFDSWSGDASGTSILTNVTVQGNTSVTATFTQDEYTIETISAHGTVTLTPNQATYHYGDEVIIEVNPDDNWAFVNWSGDLDTTENPFTFTVEGNMQITANFAEVYYLYLPLVIK